MYRSIASIIMKTLKFLEKVLIWLTIIGLAFCAGYSLGVNSRKEIQQLRESNEFKKELIGAYERYSVAVESALDTLEDYDNWVDRFDFPDYYDTRAYLDTLYNEEL